MKKLIVLLSVITALSSSLALAHDGQYGECHQGPDRIIHCH